MTAGRRYFVWIGLTLGLFFTEQASSVNGVIPEQSGIQASIQVDLAQGYVSFYGRSFQGRKTANGESFNANALTMAHRTLPFDTLVRVTHLKNKKSVIVRVNDRGPFTKGRIGDLSYAAAQQLGMVHRGLAKVSLRIVKIP